MPQSNEPGPDRNQEGVRPLKVVAIGGGTGLSTLLRGLKRYVRLAGEPANAGPTISELTAVVTVSDDGGSSGRLRKEFNILPPGDIRNCIVALSEDEALLSRLMQYRFRAESPLDGHNFGNLFLAALNGITGDFAQAVRMASEILASRGRIYPATTSNVQLDAQMEDGKRVRGETSITAYRSRIADLRLVPANANPLPETLQAIAAADLITIGPGSLYTSLVPNVLVRGISEALETAGAVRVFVCNLMTQANESLGLTAADHVRALYRHARRKIFDVALINTAAVPQEFLAKYAEEGAAPIAADIDEVEGLGVHALTGDFLDLSKGVARHARVAEKLLALAGEAVESGSKEFLRRPERANA